MSRTAIIIGAGPAGLTAAYELLARTDIKPIVLEQSDMMGGISRTVNYKGFRIDLGGHRFFTKADRVMDWWLQRFPVQALTSPEVDIAYHGQKHEFHVQAQGPDPAREDKVMLVRNRKSRIYFQKKLFAYPILLDGDTVLKLGLWKAFLMGLSYLRSAIAPIRDEKVLEQFLINRFGRRLYETFFKSYTEKVWGISCSQISASWGAQRIKGLSIRKVILHFFKRLLLSSKDFRQKNVETSLIERFLYPKYGPGQMWEEVAKEVQKRGGEIRTGWRVAGLSTDGKGRLLSVETAGPDNRRETLKGDFFISTMPVQDLIRGLTPPAPPSVQEVAEGLIYRDFFIVGLLLNRLETPDSLKTDEPYPKDNWIYLQEPDILAGRLQIFNNWSPYMVPDPDKVWVGLEYFCNETDALWKKSDQELIQLGASELQKMGMIGEKDVLDATVCRQLKTYPAYWGTYDRFPELVEFLNGFENLLPVGRNGMHKYNNQDHSMLTAMVAVDNILEGRTDKSNLWAVNTEEAYQESKK